MATDEENLYQFIYNPVSHAASAAEIGHVRLQPIDPQNCVTNQTTISNSRHAKQKDIPETKENEPEKLLMPIKEKWRLYTPEYVYKAGENKNNEDPSQAPHEKAKGINNEPLFQKYLYLFNVVIALEWHPSPATLQQIRIAARRASDFLYDATDGYMAIGQVVIFGPDHLADADIQIMASNRLHPRAWVDGLNQEYKFMPIRIGRGLWQKNSGVLLTWDTPEGYRSLAHEWAHYAFGLGDEYLKRVWLNRGAASQRRWKAAEVAIAVPTVALSVESLMANTQISEFAPRQFVIEKLKERYPCVYENVPSPVTDTTVLPRPLEGPDALPLQLPKLFNRVVQTDKDFELNLNQLDAQHPGAAPTSGPAIQSHWVYLLTCGANDGLPSSIIAQGKIGSRERERFRVLGAVKDAKIVIISQVDDRIRVMQATLDMGSDQQLFTHPWQDVTPSALNQPFFVDVIPQPLSKPIVDEQEAKYYPTHAEVSVNIVANEAPDKVCLFPVGEPRRDLQVNNDTKQWGPEKTGQLDGHVFVQWPAQDGGRASIFICSYSQGGGSDTSGGGRTGVPITAGSAEGNAMIFFLSNVPEKKTPDPQPDEGVRIVTTMLPVGQQALAPGTEARSYTFSFASNESLAPYDPTLVLYYDRDAPQQDHDLLIYRWVKAEKEAGWQPLTTYIAPDLPYVAVPLGIPEIGGALLRDLGPRIERYRVFLTPR